LYFLLINSGWLNQEYTTLSHEGKTLMYKGKAIFFLVRTKIHMEKAWNLQAGVRGNEW